MEGTIYKKILFPVDLGNLPSQESARLKALNMVKMCGSELHVMTVVPVIGLHAADMRLPDDLEKKAIEKAQEDLRSYATEKFAPDVPVTVWRWRRGAFITGQTIYVDGGRTLV